MTIEFALTGKEDREGPTKMAVAGFAGAGKTLFASTAADPLFIFFREHPRIKSIANRSIPHVKFVNHVDPDGKMVQSVQEQLFHLLAFFEMTEEAKQYKTIVFDTGDEMFQALKEGRRILNNGKWDGGDWGWLGDTMREIMGAFIDLPQDLIVNFHLKRSQEDDFSYREFALQGSSKDEAPGWFDIVGVLESYDGQTETGERFTQRALLTRSSPSYPFLKDHTFALPQYFELSRDFVGDFPKLLEVLKNPDLVPKSEREVIDRYEGSSVEPAGMFTEVDAAKSSATPVPSPDDLKATKDKTAAALTKPTKPKAKPKPKPKAKPSKKTTKKDKAADPPIKEDPDEPFETLDEAVEAVKEALDATEVDPITGEPEPTVDDLDVTDDETLGEPVASDGPAPDDPPAESPRGVKQVDHTVCAVCGTDDVSTELKDLAQMKFQRTLCKEHFKEARKATAR